MGEIPVYETAKATGDRFHRLKPYVTEYRGKPIEGVRVKEWTGVPSWKIATLVWTTLDAGLRPAEVGNANLRWLNLKNDRLLISKEESTKNEGNWEVALHPQDLKVAWKMETRTESLSEVR